MLRFIVRRLLGVIPVLFGLSILLFAFVHLLPGDPATAILGQHATPDRVEAMREYLGLDKPLWQQYLNYLNNVLHGDLGASIINSQPVLQEFLVRFPATIELTVAAMIFAAGIGIPLGRYAARHAQGWSDGAVTVVSLLGISIPVFVLGLTLQYIFAVKLNWLPATGRIDPRAGLEIKTNFILIDSLLMGRPDLFLNGLSHLILPAIALGSIPLAIITRITRASVLDVNNEDYVRTARAKGLAERRISSRHIMRNAWLPVVTVLGLQVGGLLAGAVITETVFAWGGVGLYVVDAIFNRDYFVIQNSILIFAIIFLVVNLLVDILYAVLNPRIRYA
ncbi:MAG TPA: ABC transporter permease [Candidatus Limnocylindrales bacterium]|jgi:peptide/nickel transport system permease protein|nr:ABC transporter permease [Candidatus Limnocylindrales bacterium]